MHRPRVAPWQALALAGWLLAGPAPARSQTPPVPDPEAATPFAPAAWAVAGLPEGWQLVPQLGLAVGHNSNLRQQSQARLSSPFMAWFPTLSLSHTEGAAQRQWAWRGEWTRFTESAVDSTFNQELSHEGLQPLGERSAVAWRLAAQDWHDSVGQPDPTVAAQPPDHFQAVALGGVWRHDLGEAARHRVELEPTLSRKRYRNHPELTLLANADTASLVGRYLFEMRAGGRRLGVEWRQLRTLYPDSYQALSNQDSRALLVLQWEPEADAQGTARVGLQRRQFDSLRPRQTLGTWELDWHWRLGSRTLIDAGWSRAASDVPGDGADAVVGQRASLAWTQAWTPGSRSTVTVARSRNGYVNSFVPRIDHLRSLDLAWRTDLGRRWQLGANLGWLQRESQEPSFDFRRRLVSVSLTAGL